MLVRRLYKTSKLGHCREKHISVESKDTELYDANTTPSSFARAKVGGFHQAEPQHENTFTSDAFLQYYMKRIIPTDFFDSIELDLARFGEHCATDYQALGQE